MTMQEEPGFGRYKDSEKFANPNGFWEHAEQGWRWHSRDGDPEPGAWKTWGTGVRIWGPLTPIEELVQHDTASMAVVDVKTESVLLIFHKAAQLWQFPGGHIEGHESYAEAAMREVFEETGVRPQLHSGEPLDVANYPAPAKPERPGKSAEEAHTHRDFLFVGTARVEDLAPELSEVEAAHWVHVAALAEMGSVRSDVPGLARRALELVIEIPAEVRELSDPLAEVRRASALELAAQVRADWSAEEIIDTARAFEAYLKGDA